MEKTFEIMERQDFAEIVRAQAELNVHYSGEDWADKIPVSNFLAAIFAELGELLESSPRVNDGGNNGWKWWKPYLENDVDNMKIEAVDIIHFVISVLILRYEGDLDGLIMDYTSCSTAYKDELDAILNEKDEDGPLSDLLAAVSIFALNAMKSEKEEVLNIFMFIIDALSKYVGMSPEEMKDLYMKKNVLNHKRVDGGYMEGKYQKYDENGEEDNRALFLDESIDSDDSDGD